MKFLLLNRIVPPSYLIVMLCLVLISASPAQSLDPMVVFSSSRDSHDGNRDIFIMMADGSRVRNLTKNPKSWDYLPAWSPDGIKITFTSERNKNSEVYVMDANGKNPIRLTRAPETDAAPRWSPDGAKIAFSSERDGNLEIYVMNADGENPVRLTRDPAWDGAPCSSPDGSKIAFHSNRDKNAEIYVMEINGENLTNLTQHPADDEVASWSPGQLAVSPKIRLLTLWGKVKTLQGD